MNMRAAIPILLTLVARAAAEGGHDFQWFVREERIPERGSVTRYLLVTTNHHYSFIAPEGWAVSFVRERRRIALEAVGLAGGAMAIEVREKTAPRRASDWQAWRRDATASRAPAKVIGGFPAYSATGKGEGMDLLWPQSGGAQRAARVVLIVGAGSELEFTLSTAREHFEAHQRALTRLLSSFRVDSVARSAPPKER